MLAIGFRRRRLDVAAPAALSLLLCLSMVAVVSSVPAGKLGLSALSYTVTWMLPAGMFVWLSLTWGEGCSYSRSGHPLPASSI